MRVFALIFHEKFERFTEKFFAGKFFLKLVLISVPARKCV